MCNVCVGSLTYPDYEDPFDEGEAKAWDGPVAAGRWGGQTERQEETDPVEQECHWRKDGGKKQSVRRVIGRIHLTFQRKQTSRLVN